MVCYQYSVVIRFRPSLFFLYERIFSMKKIVTSFVLVAFLGMAVGCGGDSSAKKEEKKGTTTPAPKTETPKK